MSQVFFISDLHFGHKRITDFSPKLRTGDDWLENMHILIANWNSVVKKRDVVWVLGDVAFSQDGYDALGELAGRKKMVRGNHDEYFTTEEWLKHFESVDGFVKYKQYWLSHAPMHPAELRGRGNIHGHVHSNHIRNAYGELDGRYINVSAEAVRETPISFQHILSGWYWEQLPYVGREKV